jgi:hypothetical protein
MSYKYRPFPWINVRSGNDIISGELYFYDWPGDNPKLAKAPGPPPNPPPDHHRVGEQIDYGASVALVAHTDYWKNTLIWKQLYEQVAR